MKFFRLPDRFVLRFWSCLLLCLPLSQFAFGAGLHREFARKIRNGGRRFIGGLVGPFRGGRTRAACGVAGEPNVFYVGQVDGGVWKSNDYGRTWNPIFDDEPTQSIGAIAVAPSDSNIVYVASGEGLHRPDLSVGDGIYRSTDAGKTWEHLGLRDGQQIPALAVDPHDPNRLFAAVLGHPYGPNEERGIYRSTDGGKSWKKVLYKDANTGGSDVAIDPVHPDVVYAALWESRLGPWEDGNQYDGTKGGLFKSTDGGETWQQIDQGAARQPGPDSGGDCAPAIRTGCTPRCSTTQEGGYATGVGPGVLPVRRCAAKAGPRRPTIRGRR